MMADDEMAFFRAVSAAPADATTRLVYADWLSDHGRDAEAEGWRWAAAAGLVPGYDTTDPWITYSRLDRHFLPPRSSALKGSVRLRWTWNRPDGDELFDGVLGRWGRRPDGRSVLPGPVVRVYDAVPLRGVVPTCWRVLRDEGWLWWARTPAGSFRLLAALYVNCPPGVRREVAGWTVSKTS